MGHLTELRAKAERTGKLLPVGVSACSNSNGTNGEKFKLEKSKCEGKAVSIWDPQRVQDFEEKAKEMVGLVGKSLNEDFSEGLGFSSERHLCLKLLTKALKYMLPSFFERGRGVLNASCRRNLTTLGAMLRL